MDLAPLTSVLVVNAGSSSIKLSVVGPDDEVEARADLEDWNDPGARRAVSDLMARAPAVGAVGHRVVHGGTEYRAPVLVTETVEDALLALAPLAPLHQPRAVEGMRALRASRPELTQIACFDTAFHTSIPAAASTYALPAAWRARFGIQRFGFHGLSHAYASRRAAQLVGRSGDATLRVLTCHLGAGASLCASLGGNSVDTTMGWTPLEGLVMATRSGSIDPGAVLALTRALGPDAVERGLDGEAGLAGLSGIPGGDLRAVLAARDAGDSDARLAFDVYLHQLRRELGAMIAVLGGLDVLVFTGGVGEHASEVRRSAGAALAFAGVELDADRDVSLSGEGEIGTPASRVRVFVVTAREDAEVARQTRDLLGTKDPL